MLTILILLALWQVVQSKYIMKQVISNDTLSKRIYEIHYQGGSNYIFAKHNLIHKQLRLEIRQDKYNVLDIRLIDKRQKQYQIPRDQEPFSRTFNDIENPEEISDTLYDVQLNENPLEIKVVRRLSNETIFHATNIEFSLYYLTFKTSVPTQYFFGLGERNQKGFRFKQGQYTLMARDSPKLMEDGKRPGKHVYSSQPVYLMREKSKNYHVFFFKSASPMDVIYETSYLKFVTIGGVMHWKFFLGDSHPENAVKLYHEYLAGGFSVPPFWSLGFHQSRWNYDTGQVLVDVILKHRTNNIPIDVIWSDLDYMFDRQIFTVNRDFTPFDYQTIQKEFKVKYVPLLDVAVGVKYGDSDFAFAEGVRMDIFLRSPEQGRRFQGFVWPGDSYFPDFFHPNISLYWHKMLDHLHKQVQYDGIWTDMNEPTNFCEGECFWSRMVPHDDYKAEYVVPHIAFPYLPGGVRLDKQTISSNIKHANGALHVDVHNLYGFMNSWVTYEGIKKLGKVQPFILSRSTFPGSGTICQHWFGDNAATWDFLYLSVGQIFQFNIFGMPMVGADVCGFMDDTEEKLCARWVQLGALYPFFRNHNNDQSYPQEFYSLGDLVLRSAQKNIKLRYSLLKWYYMLYFRGGRKGTIYRPLFFEFPDDQQCFLDDVLDSQIMLGEDLMSTPIIQQNQIIRKAYFPKDSWFEFLSGLMIQQSDQDPRFHLIFCPYDDYVPLFIRGGSIVLQQNTLNVLNSRDLTNRYDAIIALDMDEKGIVEQVAQGTFLDLHDFQDQNEVVEQCIEDDCLVQITLKVTDELEFIVQDKKGNAPLNLIRIQQITIYGLPFTKDEVTCLDTYDNLIKCELKATNYNYNTHIQFNGGIGFGGEKANKNLKIKFATR